MATCLLQYHCCHGTLKQNQHQRDGHKPHVYSIHRITTLPVASQCSSCTVTYAGHVSATWGEQAWVLQCTKSILGDSSTLLYGCQM